MTQEQNFSIAREFLGRLRSRAAPKKISELFSEVLEWDVAGDVSALPWLGKRTGRQAVIDFIRDDRELLERIRFEVHDILASDTRAVIVGEVASKLKFNGKISETA